MPRGKESLIRKTLELLGMERAHVRSLGNQEEMIRVNLPLDYSDWKIVRSASLEAERKKAKGIMHFRHFL